MDNEGLQLDLSAASNNNTLLREHVKNIRFYVAPLLREAIEDRVGEGNADNVRIVIVGFDGSTNHTTVGTNDTVSLLKREFNSLPKASENSTTAGVKIALDSSQCSSPSPNLANAGECQFTITAATTMAAEGMDNEGLQLDLSAASNNNTLLREHVKNIRFYVAPLLREAIEDRVGEGNADNVRIVIVGFDGSTNHTTVGTNDTVSLLKREFNSLPKASENSTTAGVKIALDSSQCSSPSPNLANAGECQFTIRLAQKGYEAAGGLTAIRPPEESGTIGLNDESEQDGTSNNNDDNNGDDSSSSSSSSSDDCDDSYPDVCIPPPPPVLDCSDIDEENFEVRGSDPHGFDSNGDGVGCEGGDDDDDDGSSSSSSSDEIDRNSISNAFTNILDDIFGDRLVIGADRMNSVLDKITEDKAQIRQTIEQIAEQIAGATDTD